MPFLVDFKALLGFGSDEKENNNAKVPPTMGGDGYHQWALPVKKDIDNIIIPANGGKGNDKYVQGLKY